MGMYTELVLKCSVKKSSPCEVLNVINHLFNGGEDVVDVPDHEFFKCSRWMFIGNCSSYYHHPKTINDVHDVEYSDSLHIFSRSDLKNYDDEINKFIDWVKPYLDHSPGECIGWQWYEEDDKPTLIIL